MKNYTTPLDKLKPLAYYWDMSKEIINKEDRIKLARQLRLKPRTIAFIEEMINNPKISQTQAYLKTHATNNPNSARASASQLLATPNVLIYTNNIENKAKKKIASLIDSEKEEIALKASQDVLDRNIGKPLQKSVSTSVNISFEQALNDLDQLTI